MRVEDHGYGAKHEADYFIALVEALGAKVESRRLVVPVTDVEVQQARALLGIIGPTRPLIAMHPGSGPISHARRWPEERFAALADLLYHRVGGHLLLLGDAEEADLHTRVIKMMRTNMPKTSLAGACSIRVTAALLASVDLFIGNDSDPMQLAVASGTPTVAIQVLSLRRPMASQMTCCLRLS
ncbi:glycosyltransferase family 9 protein [Thermobaculum terrenum]|uniref:glycosyltransferase family 9 protein n=1 Tax=Thermobaculum terrenum TaxID=166501 RepID=UPI00019BF28C|nr:glycosyltransferase family 9 protein [Thermobaculum terrenum]